MASAATCPDEQGVGPSPYATMFSCHQSVPGKDIPCAGWLAQVGDCSIRVRMALHEQRLDRSALRPGLDWPPPHDSYPEVLEKLRQDVAAAGPDGLRPAQTQATMPESERATGTDSAGD